MSESKPVGLEIIRSAYQSIGKLGEVLGAVNPLCNEVEALRARVSEFETKVESCNWAEDENGNWETDCGNCFVLEAETPSENEMKFCAYCGKPLSETAFKYDDEEPQEGAQT